MDMDANGNGNAAQPQIPVTMSTKEYLQAGHVAGKIDLPTTLSSDTDLIKLLAAFRQIDDLKKQNLVSTFVEHELKERIHPLIEGTDAVDWSLEQVMGWFRLHIKDEKADAIHDRYNEIKAALKSKKRPSEEDIIQRIKATSTLLRDARKLELWTDPEREKKAKKLLDGIEHNLKHQVGLRTFLEERATTSRLNINQSAQTPAVKTLSNLCFVTDQYAASHYHERPKFSNTAPAFRATTVSQQPPSHASSQLVVAGRLTQLIKDSAHDLSTQELEEATMLSIELLATRLGLLIFDRPDDVCERHGKKVTHKNANCIIQMKVLFGHLHKFGPISSHLKLPDRATGQRPRGTEQAPALVATAAAAAAAAPQQYTTQQYTVPAPQHAAPPPPAIAPLPTATTHAVVPQHAAPQQHATGQEHQPSSQRQPVNQQQVQQSTTLRNWLHSPLSTAFHVTAVAGAFPTSVARAHRLTEKEKAQEDKVTLDGGADIHICSKHTLERYPQLFSPTDQSPTAFAIQGATGQQTRIIGVTNFHITAQDKVLMHIVEAEAPTLLSKPTLLREGYACNDQDGCGDLFTPNLDFWHRLTPISGEHGVLGYDITRPAKPIPIARRREVAKMVATWRMHYNSHGTDLDMTQLVTNEKVATPIGSHGRLRQCKTTSGSYNAASRDQLKFGDTIPMSTAHLLLGHVNHGLLKKTAGRDGITLVNTLQSSCYVCDKAKMRFTPILGNPKVEIAENVSIWSSDMTGCHTPGIDGNTTFHIFQVQPSGFVFGYAAPSTGNAAHYLRDAITRFGVPARLHTDCAAQYDAEEWQQLLAEHGILATSTAANAPWDNSIIESTIRTLWTIVRALLFDSLLPGEYWTFAMRHAILIFNNLYVEDVPFNNRSDAFLGRGHGIRLNHFRRFGSLIMCKTPGILSKLAPRAFPAIFLGFAPRRNQGVIALDLNSRQLRIVSTFKSYTNILGSQFLTKPSLGKPVTETKAERERNEAQLRELVIHPDNHEPLSTELNELEDECPTPTTQDEVLMQGNVFDDNPQGSAEMPGDTLDLSSLDVEELEKWIGMTVDQLASVNCVKGTDGVEDIDLSIPHTIPVTVANTGRSHKAKFFPLDPIKARTDFEIPHGLDCDVNLSTLLAELDLLQHAAPVCHVEGKISHLSDPSVTQEHISRYAKNKKRSHYHRMQEKLENPLIVTAIRAEFEQILKFTVKIDDMKNLPRDVRPIYSSLKVHQKANGQWKARLVAGGDKQRRGVDFTDTWAPTPSKAALYMLLAFAAFYGLHLYAFDVTGAFLNADIDIEQWIKPPKIFFKFYPQYPETTVWRVVRALYGLHQSARLWWKFLCNLLMDFGLNPFPTEPSLYTMFKDGKLLAVVVHVDDGVIATNDPTFALELVDYLRKHVNIRDFEELTSILGINVSSHDKGITIDCKRLCLKMAEDLGLSDLPTSNTPYLAEDTTDDNLDLLPVELTATKGMTIINENRRRIGAALYASRTAIPEISYALSKAAQYQTVASKRNHEAVLRIWKYIQKTTANDEHGISFFRGRPGETLQLQVYTDATWASQTHDRRSHTGVVIYLAGGVIDTISKPQGAIAISSAEAEYYAIGTAVTTIRHYSEILDHLNHLQQLVNGKAASINDCLPEPVATKVLVKTDSNSACLATKSEKVSAMRKHIGVKYAYINSLYQAGYIDIDWIPRDRNPADGLCKRLSEPEFEAFVRLLYHETQHRSLN